MLVIFICAAIITSIYAVSEKIYKPVWEDLDQRPLPQWYDVAKIGIFVHWGIYSVPAFKTEWIWHMWDHGKYTNVDIYFFHPHLFTAPYLIYIYLTTYVRNFLDTRLDCFERNLKLKG